MFVGMRGNERWSESNASCPNLSQQTRMRASPIARRWQVVSLAPKSSSTLTNPNTEELPPNAIRDVASR